VPLDVVDPWLSVELKVKLDIVNPLTLIVLVAFAISLKSTVIKRYLVVPAVNACDVKGVKVFVPAAPGLDNVLRVASPASKVLSVEYLIFKFDISIAEYVPVVTHCNPVIFIFVEIVNCILWSIWAVVPEATLAVVGWETLSAIITSGATIVCWPQSAVTPALLVVPEAKVRKKAFIPPP